jgi:adenine-specific DNA-methyltransferase
MLGKKLELQWTNKGKALYYDLTSGKYEWVDKKDPRVSEPRILIEKESFGDPNTENILIKGDNLLALKAIEPDFYKKIKCVYIDPPYNTGSAFEHYEDGIEHSIWLTMMRDRLQILHKLLRDDGFIFVQIDDNEMAYLTVLMDEVFGRNNFINTLVWKRRGGAANPSNRLNNVTDYILWYSKTSNYVINHLFSLDDGNTKKYVEERFVYIDEKGRKYMKSPLQSPNPRPKLMYDYKGYKTPKNGWS